VFVDRKNYRLQDIQLRKTLVNPSTDVRGNRSRRNLSSRSCAFPRSTDSLNSLSARLAEPNLANVP
jgi:hypothetical protein